MWVIGGLSVSVSSSTPLLPTPYLNDVWSSADGINWRQDATAQFEPRSSPGLAIHNNELWIIDGIGYTRFNDVWRSTDGINWRVGFNQNFTTP
jgi:hypothetical protein